MGWRTAGDLLDAGKVAAIIKVEDDRLRRRQKLDAFACAVPE